MAVENGQDSPKLRCHAVSRVQLPEPFKKNVHAATNELKRTTLYRPRSLYSTNVMLNHGKPDKGEVHTSRGDASDEVQRLIRCTQRLPGWTEQHSSYQAQCHSLDNTQQQQQHLQQRLLLPQQ